MWKKMKPEVDVEDEKVVDHIGVVAVLRMHVHDPGITWNVKRKVRRRKNHLWIDVALWVGLDGWD